LVNKNSTIFNDNRSIIKKP